ncbi:molybdopterin-guanine dinucleotide biosynthesis protein B [Alkalicoccobacillus murimartini]|nr:molybdopterin-guanine dinucleotide biosynthesis protein B [Alkalicoccobacillus murimartini]
MGLNPVILQVVGYQNSGKTTLVCRLIEEASKQKLRVGTIKHHGHGGAPISKPIKDSDKHYAAGAAISAVEGDGVMHLTAQLDETDPEFMLSFLTRLPLDVILIEGYKAWHYPKVVLLRDEKDEELLDQVNQTIAVISQQQPTYSMDFPFFNRQDEQSYLSWLLEYIRGQKHE